MYPKILQALKKTILMSCIFTGMLAAFNPMVNAAQNPTRLPAEAFYRMPLLSHVKLSPDGTHIVALKNVGETTAVMTFNIATGEAFYPAKTDNIQYKFNWVDWANNERIMMSMRFDSKQFGTSVRFMETRLLAVDANKTSKMITLNKPRDDSEIAGQFQDNVIGRIPSEPDTILLGVDRETWGHPGVYKVNVNNGKSVLIKREDSTIREWYADTQGVVRAGEGYNDKDQLVIIKILDPKTNKWVKAWEYTVFEQTEIHPLGFGKEVSELYLLADHEGRQALYKADLSKEGYPWTLMLSDPHYDVSGSLIYSPVTHDVVGIYYNDNSNKSVFFDNEFKKFQAGLDKALPNATNYIVSMSKDTRKYIVYSQGNIAPGAFYFGNRDTKELKFLSDLYPELTTDVLVEKELMKYKARDGLELEGYLSRPKNSTSRPIATLIFPHGGPMSEDGKGFDEFSAFFTNMGYAVFQPNFRGSSGRGHDFMIKAVGGMGLAMQDDLEDAVKFLADQKITEPKKVCIVGASYGGYAALMGATKTPDLFQCAISFAGVSDIKKLRDTSRYFTNKNTMREQLGNDIDQLKKTSPVRMVDKIKIPILLIHGKDDSVVPVDQSRMMANELKDQHKTYEYIELPDGTHNLDYLPHRKQTFEAIETFLKKYLPL